MRVLPEPLLPLASYAQFVVWAPEWDAIKNKYQKKPKCPITGYDVDHQSPASWMTFENASAIAAQKGWGVGYVISVNDPFFCVDLDNALQADGSWSPFALEMCNAFAGAAVEVSYSGKGLHIFGTGYYPQDHRCRRDDIGLEFYTEGRFMAITGTNAVGTALHDCTWGIDYLLKKYLPERELHGSLGWTSEPVPEWDGPLDDGELIKKMLSAKKSSAAVFGTRATLQQLWEGDADALAQAYPSKTGDVYDRSSADAALCQHLAFWVGKDCERVRRLFELSGLMRDKWRDRPAYREETITRAVAWCKDVYKMRRKAEPMEPAPYIAASEEDLAPGTIRDGYQYLGLPQQLEHFKGCVYVRKLHAIFTPDGDLLKPDQFKAVYGGYWFALDSIGDKSTRNAWEAFTESQGVRFPWAHGVCFRPEVAPGQIINDGGLSLINTYVPVETPRLSGDASPFLRHLGVLLPVHGDQQLLLAFMAAVVQFKGVKFQWCPFIQGVEGNGKTLFTRCLQFAIGRRYTHLPAATDIANKFNEWLWGKLFIGVEDVYTADRQEVMEILKPLITGEDVDIQGKGKAQFTGDNRANWMLNSNHQDGVRKTPNDRRIAPFFTAQQSKEDLLRDGLTAQYFQALYGWLRNGGYAIVHDFLATYAIPDALNPALGHTAPDTSSTPAARNAAIGGVEQEILEAIAQGRPGFAGGWISSIALDRMLETSRRSVKIPHNKRRDLLKTLGFVPHPHLPDGRSTVAVAIDGGARPRLYIREGHIATQIINGQHVIDAYVKSQEVGGVTALAQEVFSRA